MNEISKILNLVAFDVSDIASRYRAQVPGHSWRVRFMVGGDRIKHVYREAADSKSARSLRSLPQSLLNFLFNNLKIISVIKVN